jgi:hypothetical protein
MRKDDKARDDSKGRVKFRFVEFELEGSNPTLQESLRNIAAAITRGNAPTSVRTIDTKSVAVIAEDGGSADTGELNDSEVVELGTGEVGTSHNGTDSKPARPSSPRTPKILDIDLNAGAVPLKDFCEANNPKTDMNKYLVIAAWFNQHGSTSEVTMDHLHTAYRHMDWHTPADASAPLRVMKTKKYGYFGRGKARGSYAINHVGENAVAKMKVK